MASRVTICDGCCCGRVEKETAETSVEYLRTAWKENDLKSQVKLTISGCLGPCKMNNVSLITSGSERIWLGKLNDMEYYEAIVDWAKEIAESSGELVVPDKLAKLQFDPLA